MPKKTTNKKSPTKAKARSMKSKVVSSNKKLTPFQRLTQNKTTMMVAFVVAFAVIGVATLLLTHAASATGQVKNVNGKCLDNWRQRAVAGNKIELYTCNPSAAQKWTISDDGSIRLAANTKYCLDVKRAGTASMTLVQLYTCNGTAAQKWKVSGDVVHYNNPKAKNLCLDNRRQGTSNGNTIWVYTCNGTAAQKWTVPKPGISIPTPVPNPTPTPTPPTSGGNGKQQTGSGIKLYQNLSGSTFSKVVNSAGSGYLVSLQGKTYTFSDFKDGTQSVAKQNFAFGAQLKVKGLLGAGSKYTVIQMNAHTSKKAGDVPSSNCGGGTGCPTNNLYLLWLSAASAKVDGITLQGTSQGHLYNGLRFDHVTNPTLSNSVIKSIPGNSSANPGETFAVNLQHVSGTSTVSNVTIDGGSVGAAGIAANSSGGTINVNNLYTTNLRYSAGIALWQQTGTVNLRNFSSINNARALGAERLGGTVNVYDPNWGTPKTGHDITYTPYSGHDSRINFYFSSASKVPNRKIIILTNTTSVKSKVHVYIGGKEQSASKYIGWQGA